MVKEEMSLVQYIFIRPHQIKKQNCTRTVVRILKYRIVLYKYSINVLYCLNLIRFILKS